MSKLLATPTMDTTKVPGTKEANLKLRRTLGISSALILLIAITGVFFCNYNRIAVGGSPKPILLLTVVAMLLVAVFGVLYSLIASKRIKSESLVYFGTLVTCGLVFCFLFVPGSVPDEGSHYASSYKYANMLMGIEPSEDSTSMRKTDYELFSSTMSTTVSKNAYRKTADTIAPIFTADESRTYYTDSKHLRGSEVTTGMSNSPQMRLAPSLGLLCGQFLGLNGLWTFYLGRVFNLIWFATLALIAFRITPIAKPAFIAISLLPMTLHLAASYSYDVSPIGFSMVLTALCLNARYSKESVPGSTLAAITIVAFLLAPCKVVYSALILLVFIIPKRKFKSKKGCYLFRTLVFVGAFAGIALLSIPSLVTISGIGEQTASISESADEDRKTRTIADLASNPLATLFLYLNTIYTQGTFYVNSFLGGSLGWFQAEIAAPGMFMIAYGTILIASAQRSANEALTITKKNKCLFALILSIIFLSVLTSLCLDWTSKSEFVIQGVQGRYFLPCGVLLLLLLRLNRFSTTIQLESGVPLSLYGLNMAYAIFILSTALRIL